MGEVVATELRPDRDTFIRSLFNGNAAKARRGEGESKHSRRSNNDDDDAGSSSSGADATAAADAAATEEKSGGLLDTFDTFDTVVDLLSAELKAMVTKAAIEAAHRANEPREIGDIAVASVTGVLLRLDFLLYILRHSKLTLTTQCIAALWDVLAPDTPPSSSPLGGVWGVARRHIRELFFSFVRLCSYTSQNRGALRGNAAFGFSVSRDLLVRMDRSIRTTAGVHSSLGSAEYFCYQHLFVGVNSREGRLSASPDTRILVERKFSNEDMPPQLHNENILGCRIRILMKGGVYVAGTITEHKPRVYDTDKGQYISKHKITLDNNNVCGGEITESLENSYLNEWWLLPSNNALDAPVRANILDVYDPNLVGVEGLWCIALQATTLHAVADRAGSLLIDLYSRMGRTVRTVREGSLGKGGAGVEEAAAAAAFIDRLALGEYTTNNNTAEDGGDERAVVPLREKTEPNIVGMRYAALRIFECCHGDGNVAADTFHRLQACFYARDEEADAEEATQQHHRRTWVVGSSKGSRGEEPWPVPGVGAEVDVLRKWTDSDGNERGVWTLGTVVGVRDDTGWAMGRTLQVRWSNRKQPQGAGSARAAD